MIKNKPFIIGEIGINHNGNLDLTRKLIENSKKANFDAVKFQKRDLNLVYTKKFLDGFRESPWGNTQRDQKKGLEFEEKEYQEVEKICKENNIEWFASAWDINSLRFLEKFQIKYNKIASAMIVDLNFLSEAAKMNKHTFISTGMSTINDLDEAVNIFQKNNCSFELMHCISIYPLANKDVNLKTIQGLKNRYNCDIGYSGHENGVLIAIAAFLLGATSIEKHITLDRTMYGSDQSASIEFSGMKKMTEQIQKIIEAYGEDKTGEILDGEVEIAKKLRAHINI